MNKLLFMLLDAHIGHELTHDLALKIAWAAGKLEPLVDEEKINRIAPETHGDLTFAVEKMEEIQDEMEPLHHAHWMETEGHRHGLELKPDYSTFIQYEQAGRYILFTVRREGVLVGNCAMYLSRSTHTQTLLATEDTLYLLPRARVGDVAKRFVAFCEAALMSFGVREITVSVKIVNRAGLFFQRLGYRHVENGLTKVLEDHHAQTIQ